MNVNHQEIFEWVEAADMRSEFAEQPPHILEAVQTAESRDRTLLIDTAIRVPLMEALEIKQGEITRLQHEVIQIEGLLYPSKPAIKYREGIKPGPIIKPFTLITEGIRYIDCHRFKGKLPDEKVRFNQFKGAIKNVIGPELNTITASYLMRFLLSKKQTEREAGVIGRSTTGITFLSNQPDQYRALAGIVDGFGESSADKLVMFLAGVSGMQDPSVLGLEVEFLSAQ